MNLIRFAIQNPVKVTVGVILLVLFGLLALFRIPIQLTPNVDEPFISINTFWEGASPEEVEREILERQEEKLKGIEGLKKMAGVARENSASINLEFFVGVDQDRALRDASEKLRQVTGYPEDIEEPTIVASDASMERPIAWMILRGRGAEPFDDLNTNEICDPGERFEDTNGNGRWDPPEDITLISDWVEDNVKPMLERVPGVAAINVYGGREREVQVQVDAAKLAARGLTFRDLQAALQGQNASVSAGTITQGKRDYTFRTIGQYEDVAEVENTVVAYRQGGPIYVKDVARVVKTYKKQYGFVRSLTESKVPEYVLALPAFRQTGTNVMEVMAALRQAITGVNDTILHPLGRGLELTQVYDETTYIRSAIDIVVSNVYIGGFLTILVLMVFLRSGTGTLIVATCIPISVIGTFLAVSLLGRSLNVVMLAGMAFAVGMVVDNSIVVLENIYRHRQMGKDRITAALEGGREVWGAILSSSLTTMAVFIPVIFVEEEAGQLFRDIAIAIAVAVGLSMLVAVIVVPTFSAKVLRKTRKRAESGRFATWLGRTTYAINGSVPARVAIAGGLTALSLVGCWLLMPPTTYLPTGNQNFVWGGMISPPGYSIEEYKRMGRVIEQALEPYWLPEPGSPQAAALPPVQMTVGGSTGKLRVVEVQPAPIDHFFFVSYIGRCFMGAISAEDDVVKPLVNVMLEAASLIPGSIPFVIQPGLFSFHPGNSVEVEIRGPDLSKVTAAAQALFYPLLQEFGFPQPSPMNYDKGKPEIRCLPDREKISHLGMNTRDVAFIVKACVDGAIVGGFRDQGDEIDLTVLISETQGQPAEAVAQVPICAPTGQILPLSAVTHFLPTSAPEQINHIEEQPAVSFTLNPPPGIPLESVMDKISGQIVLPMRQAGQIDDSVIINLAGNADKLIQVREALLGEWHGWSWDSLSSVLSSRLGLALLVTYLLMAGLFESFLYPFVIMFTVPLATVGGFAFLRAVHFWTSRSPLLPIQELDVVTMLGFAILIGVVVNNAILIVHQTLNNLRYHHMAPREAISESVRTRVRPIFMTALTTCFGLLPLVVRPGAGSELYRGLGSVVLGGLLVSTIFTLLLTPALLSLLMDVRSMLGGVLFGGGAVRPAEAGMPAATANPRPSPNGQPKHSPLSPQSDSNPSGQSRR